MIYRCIKRQKCNKYLLIVVLCIIFISLKRLPYANQNSDCFRKALKGPIAYDDHHLIEHIRNEVLIAPSTKQYNLHTNGETKLKSTLFYQKMLQELFNEIKNGFFVEAGALDGEIMSNTLWLEKHRGWTGLLVEPDPINFKVLLSKNRKSWAANVCLSMEKYPKEEIFTSSDVESTDDINNIITRGMGSILRGSEKAPGVLEKGLFKSYYTSQCFPLASLLLALNVKKIDLLSLDVEMVESFIIQNFDFRKFDVQVVFVETYEDSMKIYNYLTSQDFVFIDQHFVDFVYCKKYSPICSKMIENNPAKNITIWENKKS